jgi:hypothetical protein
MKHLSPCSLGIVRQLQNVGYNRNHKCCFKNAATICTNSVKSFIQLWINKIEVCVNGRVMLPGARDSHEQDVAGETDGREVNVGHPDAV